MSLVTLEQAKLWLRVDHDDEDALISDLIGEAEQYLKDATGRPWPETHLTARRYVLAYITDAYENRGLDTDGRRTLSPTLQSIMQQLQLAPEPDGEEQ